MNHKASLGAAALSLLALWNCGDSDETTATTMASTSSTTATGGGTASGGSSGVAAGGSSQGGSAQGGSGQGGSGDNLYRPDNGPDHTSGTVVDVCTEAEILSAIAGATPGDVITICPGSFNLNQRIDVQNDGQAAARIFLRAAAEGTVTLNLSHIENFAISAKFWIFENIEFNGACTNGNGCEHAFHIVGDADDVIIRNNEIVNFASHVKLNGTVAGGGPAKNFPDRTWFINNFWHNTKFIENSAPHNILNLDGGKDHVVRGNIFADYATSPTSGRSASAVYPKASTVGILIEQNLVVCEKVRTNGETTRGIQLGDGAPVSICDGDVDQDGNGDCNENGQNQLGLVRNNIVMNCNNGGSAAALMVSSDRESKIFNNTAFNADPRTAGFSIGHPDHDTFWRYNILENGINDPNGSRPVVESNNIMPTPGDIATFFNGPNAGDLSLAAQGNALLEQIPTDADVPHDFCGYPRGPMADLGAVEYSTAYGGTACATLVKQMFDRIP